MHTLSSKRRRAASRGLVDGRKTLIGIAIALGSKFVGVESGDVHSVMDAVKELWPVWVGISADLATLWARVRAVDFDKGVFRTKVFWLQLVSAVCVAAGAFGFDVAALEGIVTRSFDAWPAVVALFGSVVAIVGRMKAKGPVRGIGSKGAGLLMLGLLPLVLMSCASGPGPESEPEEPGSVCPAAGRDVRQASCVAVKSVPSLTGALFGWAKGGNLWRRGADGKVHLRVRFLGGDAKQRELAWKRFQVIDELAEGLEVRLAGDGEASDIRVAFDCQGHWSRLGKEAAYFPEKATINIELSRWDDAREWDRVALHEFMHALGVEHEQQHPNHEIPWDKEKVYAHFWKTQGWDREMVDFQVLQRGDPAGMRTSGFDVDSLMMYPIPAELTTNGFSVGWNTRLSPLDIVLLQELYPRPRV